jgi:hypothetical protein
MFLAVLMGLMISRLAGAERVFDFGESKPGDLPSGFRAFRAGTGKAGDWKLVLDEVDSMIQPFSSKAAAPAKLPVLAQLARDPADERFPVVVFDEETYGDMTFSTRVKVVEGAFEQIAGVVFRVVNETNFYVARINTADGNIRFYKFVNGQRTPPIGNDIALKKGQWHQLSVSCLGNRIRIQLNGKEAMPELTDNSFATGKIGFITKSDTVAYFTDARITFKPLETLAANLVRQVLERQPRLLNLRIYGRTTLKPDLHVLAAKDPKDAGMPAGETESKVFKENQAYFAKEKGQAIVTAPLHDRNGETIGVVKFFLKPFTGQTEANTIGRVLPTLHEIEQQVGRSDDLSAE